MGAKFLIAHPDTFALHALEVALRDAHHNVRVAHEGLDAIDRALDEKPDGIVLGFDLPGLGGLDVARALRALEPTRHIPILFIADNAEQAAIVAHSGLPQVSCMLGPIDLVHVQEQVAKLLRGQAPAPEPRAVEPDQHLAGISDPLTGLYARHYLLHRLAYEAARSARYQSSLACILFGVEDFKRLVEEIGRPSAERVLVETANVFRRSARVTDIIGRAGEDEFLMIAPHTDLKGANHSAARLQRLICEHHFDLPAKHSTINIAVGLAAATGPSLADNLALLGRAEAALIRAREGKEKIMVG